MFNTWFDKVEALVLTILILYMLSRLIKAKDQRLFFQKEKKKTSMIENGEKLSLKLNPKPRGLAFQQLKPQFFYCNSHLKQNEICQI